ncbi:uncharacterized protein LOC130696785 [Daphnia carinata]|uniref:uncharacterized protein LOC130696785 n=1 Tax=Daphnia carinata TaxID=120202 RepID=UPI00257DD7A0|nr:uncharacterized protein LOC130696785 [Daphnia carinata]
MVGVTSSWSVPRWIMVSIFLIGWIHLSAGKCQHYGHACLGAHGKKRAEESFTINSIRLPQQNPVPIPRQFSFLANEDSSEEVMKVSATEPGDHFATQTRRLIGRRLPPGFIFTVLTSQRNGG